MIYSSILDCIGQTPLIPLKRVIRELDCTVYAKCEFLNPGGSVKDRIALMMIEDAEKSGRIKPGDTLIEPTSGNTGIGLALAGAVKGYRVIITMPEKMSHEKQVVLESLGAEIIRTPTEAAWDDPASHIEVAKRMQKEIPNAHILDQYSNKCNPEAHFRGTGAEIVEDLKGKRIDMLVMGTGTGGTLTGTARAVKEYHPACQIVGVDPVGSILANENDEVSSYEMEGIGYDFIPDVLDRSLVDEWVKTNDQESFRLGKRLIHEEGFLCGGSSGAALAGVMAAAPKLSKDQICVVVLPDNVRNYLTKFIDKDWMKERSY